MRLWTLHPRYLDPAGLVALWREALLARAVLLGRTVGYRHHPQLIRFRSARRPVAAINAYLAEIQAEARRRGYRFDRSKVGRVRETARLPETEGQLRHEWAHLKRKLRARNPQLYRRLRAVPLPDPHPLFRVVPGPVRAWDRGAG